MLYSSIESMERVCNEKRDASIFYRVKDAGMS